MRTQASEMVFELQAKFGATKSDYQQQNKSQGTGNIAKNNKGDAMKAGLLASGAGAIYKATRAFKSQIIVIALFAVAGIFTTSPAYAIGLPPIPMSAPQTTNYMACVGWSFASYCGVPSPSFSASCSGLAAKMTTNNSGTGANTFTVQSSSITTCDLQVTPPNNGTPYTLNGVQVPIVVCDKGSWNGTSCIWSECPAGTTLNAADGLCYSACPLNATVSGTACACNTGFHFDATQTSCVSDCPVTPLKKPPPPFTGKPSTDACSNALEAGDGVDQTGACKALGIKLTDNMNKAAACIATKIKALANPKISYAGPSATIRTQDYQDHLLAVWRKTEEYKKMYATMAYSQDVYNACAAPYLDVFNNELQKHSLKYAPSASEGAAAHVMDNAIDIPMAVVDAMYVQVTTEVTTVTKVNGKNKYTTTVASDIGDYMNSKTTNPSPECNSSPVIYWGGNFNSPDWVHFYVN